MKNNTIFEFMNMTVEEFESVTKDEQTKTELQFKIYSHDADRYLSEFLDFEEACALVDCLNDWIDRNK